jgi:chemotaxis protein MotB
VPFPGGERGYSNWELSADRANASRRELVAGGLPEDRMLRVQGLASSQPLDRQDPEAPSNRRISIIVMNREAEQRALHSLQPEPDTALAAAPGETVELPPTRFVERVAAPGSSPSPPLR